MDIVEDGSLENQIMNNIKYLQKQESDEDYDIDLSFSHYGKNLHIDNIILDCFRAIYFFDLFSQFANFFTTNDRL